MIQQVIQNTEEKEQKLLIFAYHPLGPQNKLISKCNIGFPVVSIDSNEDFIILISNQSQIYAYDHKQFNVKQTSKRQLPLQLKTRNKYAFDKITCGVHHCIMWNKRQIFGCSTSCSTEHIERVALGYGNEQQHLSLYMNPRKIPIFIPCYESIESVTCGNSTTIIQVGQVFYALGDNNKKQLGHLLKKVVSEPEIMSVQTSYMLGDNKNNQISKIQCGDGLTIATDSHGNLYGAGDFDGYCLRLQDNIRNGLNPVSLIVDREEESLVSGIKDIYCKQIILVITQENDLIVFKKSKQPLKSKHEQFHLLKLPGQCISLIFSSYFGIIKTIESQYYSIDFSSDNVQFDMLNQPDLFIQSSVWNDHLYSITSYNTASQYKHSTPNTRQRADKQINQRRDSDDRHLANEGNYKKEIDSLKKQVNEQKQIIRLYELYVEKLEKQLENRELENQSGKIEKKEQSGKQVRVPLISETGKGYDSFRDLKYILKGLLKMKQTGKCTKQELFF